MSNQKQILTEKEIEAVGEEANLIAGISDDKFANYSKKYDAYDLWGAIVKGAELLAQLRKNPLTESLVEWAQRNGYSMRSGGNWERGSAIESDESLMRMYNAELRNEEAPSVDIDSLAEWEYTMELQNLNDRLGANEAFKEGIIVGIKAGMRVKEEAPINPSTFIGALENVLILLNGSEVDVAKNAIDGIIEHLKAKEEAPSEEFTEQLRHILIMHGMEGMDNISESISEIAKLLTPDVNAELLDAVLWFYEDADVWNDVKNVLFQENIEALEKAIKNTQPK